MAEIGGDAPAPERLHGCGRGALPLEPCSTRQYRLIPAGHC